MAPQRRPGEVVREGPLVYSSPSAASSPDFRLLVTNRCIRGLCNGAISVTLALYLSALGVSLTTVGAVLGTATIGGAVMTLCWARVSQRIQRRTVLKCVALLMTCAGLVFSLTENLGLIFVVSFLCGVSVSGGDLGASNMLEQAILPQLTPPDKRVRAFSIYNVFGSAATAFGASTLASVEFSKRVGLTGADTYLPLLMFYSLLSFSSVFIVGKMSDSVEVGRGAVDELPLATPDGRQPGGDGIDRWIVRLSSVYFVDALAGGLVVQTYLAYWFVIRWDLPPSTLALLFFIDGVLAALMMHVSSYIVRAVGLVRTIVVSQVFVGVTLLLMPLMPSIELTVGIFILRSLASQVDVPSRQTYAMTMVAPQARPITAGLTNIVRTTGAAGSTTAAGALYGLSTLAVPLLLSGGLKLLSSYLMYRGFGNDPPPFEAKRFGPPAAGGSWNVQD